MTDDIGEDTDKDSSESDSVPAPTSQPDNEVTQKGERVTLAEAFDSFNPAELPALTNTLAELRRRYDDEEIRRVGLETKIGGLVAADTLLLTIIATDQTINPILIGAIIATLVLSVIVSLWGLQSRKYKRPVEQISHFTRYGQDETKEFEKEFCKLYAISAAHNQDINDKRYLYFRIGLLFAFISIIFYGFLNIIAGFGVENICFHSECLQVIVR